MVALGCQPRDDRPALRHADDVGGGRRIAVGAVTEQSEGAGTPGERGRRSGFAIRRGLRADPSETTFETPTFASAIRPGLDLTKALALASSLEDDEILRKVELGK